MTGRDFQFRARRQARQLPCPTCKAQPGQDCRSVMLRPQKNLHSARLQAGRELLQQRP